MSDSGPNQTIQVDVWSDVACPWCYVGKRKLELGIQEFTSANPQTNIDVVFHSFQLDPSIPSDYEGTHQQYLVENKGFPAEQIGVMHDRLAGIGAAVGLNYNFDQVQTTNTQLAHELMQFAKTLGKQIELKERIMNAYFSLGQHVGKVDVLVGLAGQVGIDEAAARKVLVERTYRAEFEADVAQAREFGISGVPFFVIQNKYGIEGAQGPEMFVHAFETVQAELADSAPRLNEAEA
jgi:predicted DsbA family dithiol-disulfide isomerase